MLRSLSLSLFLLAGCTAGLQAPLNQVTTVANGFSGLVLVEDEIYLGIHDTKSFEDAVRLSLFDVQQQSERPVTVEDWEHAEGRSSDLEAGCAVPGRANEFLVAESGDWKGQYGRVFHLRLNVTSSTAQVLGVADFPTWASNSEDATGDQFEGLTCLGLEDDRVLLLLGERGGSEKFVHGRLRWATLNLDTHALSFTDVGSAGLELNAPGAWTDDTLNRDIAALHLDEEGQLWVAATEDFGDDGPFRSVVYRAGTVTANVEATVALLPSFSVARMLPGVKIEAIARAPASLAGFALAIGTEDENLGGTWRIIR